MDPIHEIRTMPAKKKDCHATEEWDKIKETTAVPTPTTAASNQTREKGDRDSDHRMLTKRNSGEKEPDVAKEHSAVLKATNAFAETTTVVTHTNICQNYEQNWEWMPPKKGNCITWQ